MKIVNLYFLILTPSLILSGCAGSDYSSVLYKNNDFAVQQVADNRIVVHNSSEFITEKIEANPKEKNKIQVYAPSENYNNAIILRHGENANKYLAYAWPNKLELPCVIKKEQNDFLGKIDVEWITPRSYSVFDHKSREVKQIVAYDESIFAWTQFFPNRKVLEVCPIRSSLIEGGYEAGKMQVIASVDGKILSIFYNNELYNINLNTPLQLPTEDRISVAPDGEVAILSIIDNGNIRLFAWSAKKVEPTEKVIKIDSNSKIKVSWLSNRSVAISDSSKKVTVIRYNLDRSWQEILPAQLP